MRIRIRWALFVALVVFGGGIFFERIVLDTSGKSLAPIASTAPLNSNTPEQVVNPPSGLGQDIETLKNKVGQKNEYGRVKSLAEEICENIYPQPPTDAECVDKINHGIASAFDPHTAYMNKDERKVEDDRMNNNLEGIGVVLSKEKHSAPLRILKIIHGGAAEHAGIEAGDVIVRVDGTLGTEFKNVYGAVKAIRGVPGTQVTLEVSRASAASHLLLTLTRQKITIPQITTKLLSYQGKTYGLILTTQFGEHFADDLKNAVSTLMASPRKLDGIITSVEDNGGGLVREVINALDLFMDEPSFVLERTREGIKPFGVATGDGDDLVHTPGDITNGLPILVVVNRGSASASEIYAAAMQHFGRALVYGTGTYQKGTIQASFPLDDTSLVKITIAEYLVGTMDDWIPVQCVGITPDVMKPVSPSDTSGDDRMTECEQSNSIPSGGPMKDPPKHVSFAESHLAQYGVDLEMIKAYTKYTKEREIKPPSKAS